ncbi:MAG: hypothetical protein WBG46_13800 [Nonlabens sp.]
MRILLFVLSTFLFISCNNQEQSEKEEVVLDKVASSDTYEKYVAAYQDYKSCKEERPQLTQDYMEEKITADEFKNKLSINNKACNIKKDIYNRYYRLLQAEFDKEAAAYEIKEE